MALGDKMPVKAPEGYDQKLWESIPSVKAQLYPGKHQTYVYGQSSADGTACIGCAWQTHLILNGRDAVLAHDHDKGFTHDHSIWVEERGHCPCGESTVSEEDKIKAEALEEFYRKISGEYALNFASADELYEQIRHLLKRDAATYRKEY